jgi:hypothetical protein
MKLGYKTPLIERNNPILDAFMDVLSQLIPPFLLILLFMSLK